MAQTLNDVKVAILATDGFEQSELLEPRRALDEAGAKTEVVSLKAGNIKAWNHKDWGENVTVDKTVDFIDAKHYDALLLPGGVMNPDNLRMDTRAVAFVKAFFEAKKPVAAISSLRRSDSRRDSSICFRSVMSRVVPATATTSPSVPRTGTIR
jgi:protease I